MILAKEIDGELWVKASDHHRVIKDAQRTWVGLTDEEIEKLTVELRDIPVTLAFAIEAKLKEKNNG
jgi:uncharacterized protein YecT (DUF1311 family)